MRRWACQVVAVATTRPHTHRPQHASAPTPPPSPSRDALLEAGEPHPAHIAATKVSNSTKATTTLSLSVHRVPFPTSGRISRTVHAGPGIPFRCRLLLSSIVEVRSLLSFLLPRLAAGPCLPCHLIMASDAWLSLPSRLPSLLPRPVPRAAFSSTSMSRCRIATSSLAWVLGHGWLTCPGWRRHPVWAAQAAADQQGGVRQQQDEENDVVDSNVLPYCSIDRKDKKTIGEMEQEFLQALQAFYYDKKAIMSNEEFDNLKEELMWEGSSVVMLSPDEQRLLEASMAYVAGNPIMTDAEFDELKLRLRKEGSEIVQEGPRCSLRSRKVYSDLTVDYFKMFLLNVPAAVVALILFFFLDDLTGFEITYLLELPEPFSFIFTWFAALPLIFWVAQAITSAILKDFLILKGPCPNCGNENLSFFGTILSVPSGGARNSVKCANCGSSLVYDSASRLITLPETAEA